MPITTITNSRGVVVANINVGTTTGASFPVEIQGQAIAPYGAIYGDSIYHLMENFANSVEPPNPVEGMDFYNTLLALPHFYNGTNFIPYITAATGTTGLFTPLPTAVDIDMTSAPGTTFDLFTAPADGTTYHPTTLILIPKTVVDVTGPAQIALEIAASEDVMENTLVANPSTDAHHYFSIEGTTRFLSGGETITLELADPATGGGGLDFTVDAFVFGWNKVM
jgi:hypothetical protein